MAINRKEVIKNETTVSVELPFPDIASVNIRKMRHKITKIRLTAS